MNPHSEPLYLDYTQTEPEWLPLDALHYFEVLAQSPNFSVAARQLGMTQQALSKSLARLEVCLQVTLIRRRPLTLTPAGEILFKQAQAILNPCRQIEQRYAPTQAHAQASANEAALKLAVPACLSAPVLSGLKGLQAKEGLFPLQLCCDLPITSATKALNHHKLDLLLMPGPALSKQLSSHFWTRTQACWVARPSTVAQYRPGSTFKQPDLPLIRAALPPPWDQDPLWPNLASSLWSEVDFFTALELVLIMDALLWVPKLAIEGELAAGDLELWPHPDTAFPSGPEWELHWVWDQKNPQANKIKAFLNLLPGL